jgi:tRNA (guanine37-N1)-methyltransferase
MSFNAAILTLFPDMFPGPLGYSLAGDALKRGLWSLQAHQIRDYGLGKHQRVDDTPAGGGAGMVLRCDVMASALDHVLAEDDQRPRLLMSPRGKPLAQKQVRDWAQGPGVVIICGRFEGVDERVIEGRNLIEVSIGDYILSGGELAAMVLLDSCIRLLPGVMGKAESGQDESFENNRLEYPHYTRPREWEGREIPPVLLGGDHAAIARWRQEQADRITEERRPDLLMK